MKFSSRGWGDEDNKGFVSNDKVDMVHTLVTMVEESPQ